jgi:hypothetical protein
MSAHLTGAQVPVIDIDVDVSSASTRTSAASRSTSAASTQRPSCMTHENAQREAIERNKQRVNRLHVLYSDCLHSPHTITQFQGSRLSKDEYSRRNDGVLSTYLSLIGQSASSRQFLNATKDPERYLRYLLAQYYS